jgi:hypothetical protein
MNFTFQYTYGFLIFDVEAEYEAAEIGSVDSYGLKNEPDYPATVYIISVIPQGSDTNIIEMIKDEVIDDMIDVAHALIELEDMESMLP